MNDLPRPSPLAADPYWSNVVLLCHCDGTSGQTTFTDVSSRNHTLTQSASPVTVDTTNKKFGTGSGKFVSANSQQLTVTDNLADFNLQGTTWTIDIWVKSTVGVIPGIMCANSGNYGWSLFVSTGYYVAFSFVDVTVGSAQDLYSTAAINDGAWHLYSVERTGGGTVYLYSDGVIRASRANSDALSSGLTDLDVGADPYTSGAFMSGNIDEFRITKGVARYGGASFTPPSTAFPDASSAAVARPTMVIAT